MRSSQTRKIVDRESPGAPDRPPLRPPRIRGEAATRQHALLRAFGMRQIAVTPEQIEQVLGCQGIATLDRWLERALTAASAAEVLADAGPV